MNQITPQIWVGDMAALHPKFLHEAGIKTIINLHTVGYTIGDTSFSTLHLPLTDDIENDPERLKFVFHICKVAIERNPPVLIHCYAGVSRSANMAAAVIESAGRATWDYAARLVKEARPQAHLDTGFSKSLRKALSIPS